MEVLEVCFFLYDIYYDCFPERVEIIYTPTRNIAGSPLLHKLVHQVDTSVFHADKLKWNHFNYFITSEAEHFFLSYLLLFYEKTGHNSGLLICKCLWSEWYRCFCVVLRDRISSCIVLYFYDFLNLLRYNLHTIKFLVLGTQFSDFLVNLPSCVAVTIIHS